MSVKRKYKKELTETEDAVTDFRNLRCRWKEN